MALITVKRYLYRVATGTYTVTAKNSYGCISAGTSATINAQPPTPVAPTVTLIQPTCTLATGTITVTAPTGTGMTIASMAPITSQALSLAVVATGTYTVTVKNSYGCISAGTSATINAQPPTPCSSNCHLIQPTCTLATGTITVTAPTEQG